MLRSTTGSGSRSDGVDGDVGEVVEGEVVLGAVGAGDAGGVKAAAGGVVVGGALVGPRPGAWAVDGWM